jgi:hypothetical protein
VTAGFLFARGVRAEQRAREVTAAPRHPRLSPFRGPCMALVTSCSLGCGTRRAHSWTIRSIWWLSAEYRVPSSNDLGGLWLLPQTPLGVDTAGLLTRVRHFSTGPGLRTLRVCCPPFSFLCAVSLPQPSACVRTCRDRLRLRLGSCCRRVRPVHSTRSEACDSEADHWTESGGDCPQGSRGPVSMGRRIPRRWVRLLRPCLLGLRETWHRPPAQLIRAL